MPVAMSLGRALGPGMAFTQACQSLEPATGHDRAIGLGAVWQEAPAMAAAVMRISLVI